MKPCTETPLETNEILTPDHHGSQGAQGRFK